MSQIAKEEQLKKYNLDESHNTWEPMIDNWMSVEVARQVLGGALPEPGDSRNFAQLFLDDKDLVQKTIFDHENGGSVYLTAKRMMYRSIMKSL